MKIPTRVDKKSGKELSMLGFGCMRFSPVGNEAENMLLAAIEGGVNYFDTAYVYPGSEKTLGRILAKHGKRKDVYIATKLPIAPCRKYEDFERIFSEQLERLQTDYIDYYLIHNITQLSQWEGLQSIGIEKWLAEKKRSGQIKHVGFSYHGSGTEFPHVIDAYDWEMVMIQYNYYDENYQAGRKGLEYAAAKDIPVMIMEPLLGGKLATGLPKKAARIFKAANENRTPAQWAFNWLYNHPQITTVLSGMTNEKITRDNMQYAADFTPLAPAELAVYADVIAEFKKSYKVQCTGCNYCLPCPKGIDIPHRLAAYNASYAQSWITGAAMYFTAINIMSPDPIFIDRCNNCGKCEKLCPQNIPIRDTFVKIKSRFENWFLRGVLKIARAVMRR